MPRYFDADKVVELIKNYGKGAISDGHTTLDAVDDIVCLAQAIDYIPTADVAEVKHGEWKEAEDGDGIVCSVCGSDFCTLVFDVYGYNYCPNCGAKMGGKDESI